MNGKRPSAAPDGDTTVCRGCGRPMETHAMFNPPRCPVVRLPAVGLPCPDGNPWCDGGILHSERCVSRASFAEISARAEAAVEDGDHPQMARDVLLLVEIAEAATELNESYGFEYAHPALARLEDALEKLRVAACGGC